jgi:hypothetical protein
MRIGLKLLLGFTALASLVGLVGLLSWYTNQQIALQIEQLRRSSIIGFVDAGEMAISLHSGHAAAHELLDARRAARSEAGNTPQVEQTIKQFSAEIEASLISFKRSLERSRQATQAIIAWRQAHPTLENHKTNLAQNEKLLAELQRKLRDRYDWPGNVRELKHAVEFAVVRAKTDAIGLADLPPEIQAAAAESLPVDFPIDERGRILAALRHTEGNRKAAAKLLGMSRATFYRRLSQLGITEDA